MGPVRGVGAQGLARARAFTLIELWVVIAIIAWGAERTTMRN